MSTRDELVKQWRASHAWNFEDWLLAEVDRLRAELAAASARIKELLKRDWDREGELAAVKAEQIRPVLAWTTTPPTEPGCYWTRDDEPGEPVLVTVRREANGEIWAECCDLGDVIEWWGPIPRPPGSP